MLRDSVAALAEVVFGAVDALEADADDVFAAGGAGEAVEGERAAWDGAVKGLDCLIWGKCEEKWRKVVQNDTKMTQKCPKNDQNCQKLTQN